MASPWGGSCQSLMVRSTLDVAKVWPSGLKATPKVGAVCPVRTKCSVPVTAFHTRTAESLPALASQLYAAYARAAQARVLASVVGIEGLAETDRQYLRFGTAFEQTLVTQSEARTLEQSMALGWTLLAGLPRSELTRLSDAQIAAHVEGHR